MTTKPVPVKLKTSSTGKVTVEPKPARKSVSQKIARAKNPKRTYRKATP